VVFGAALTLARAGVSSGNAAGYVKIDIPVAGNYVMVGLNMRNIGKASLTLLDLFGTNTLIRNSRSSAADRIAFFGSDQNYHSFYQKTDGQFYEVGGTSPTNPAVASGQAFWITPPSAATSVRTICLQGEAVVDTLVDKTLTFGLNMLAHTFATPWNVSALDWRNTPNATANSRSSAADRISVWSPASGYSNYYLDADFDWHEVGGNKVPSLVIPVGGAIWYTARKDGVRLTQSRPFNWP
jgi:hypothetical protein